MIPSPYAIFRPDLGSRTHIVNVSGGAGPPGPPGPAGPQGVGVHWAGIDQGTGNLVIILTDGTQIAVGKVIGPQGEAGPPGEAGVECNLNCVNNGFTEFITISDDHVMDMNCPNVYVTTDHPISITLPQIDDRDILVIIKSGNGAPVGNRKITIMGSDGDLIDQSQELILKKQFACAQLATHDGKWHVISIM